MRLVAAVLDFSVLMVVMLVLQLSWTTERGGETVPTSASTWISVGVAVAYFVVSHAVIGQTLGKRMCRLVVVTTSDAPIGWIRSFARFAVAFGAFALGPWIARLETGLLHDVLAVVQVAVPLIVYLPILLRPDRRGLHDLAAGTVVRSLVPPLSSLLSNPGGPDGLGRQPNRASSIDQ
ncbi:MAG: RDD family protein [Microthrixaceae bacterium]